MFSINDAISCRTSQLLTPSARFGQRLRELRNAQGYTQEALAAYTGIDRSFISDVERGKKGISVDYLDTIAKGFEITISELMTGV